MNVIHLKSEHRIISAGLAYGRTNHNFIDAAGANHDISTTKIGFAAGLGGEYALDPRWSVKAEALYVDLGKDQTTVSGVAFGNFPSRFETADTMWILRARREL